MYGLQNAKIKVNDYIDMLYISALSKLHDDYRGEDSELNIAQEEVSNYLLQKGYVKNSIKGKNMFTYNFTVVILHESEQGLLIEVKHDLPNSKSSFVTESLLTGLPIALNYFNQI
jgi:hypothetical protein